MRVKLYVFPVIAVLALILVRPAVGRATCSASFFNPITDICWDCIFPVAIGGITIFGSDIDSPGDDISSPICICGTTIGLSASFWEPARIIETVKDPGFNLIRRRPGRQWLSRGRLSENHQGVKEHVRAGPLLHAQRMVPPGSGSLICRVLRIPASTSDT